MKVRVVIAAALVLTACGGQTKPAADTTAGSDASAVPAASSERPTTAAAAPAKGERPTRDFVIGKWGTDGDCTLAIDLRADGTSDGPFGNWSYTDGAISFADAPELKVNVTVLDSNTMQSTNNDGKTTKMTRCP